MAVFGDKTEPLIAKLDKEGRPPKEWPEKEK